MLDDLNVLGQVVKSLLDLCDEGGLSAPFTKQDVDDLIQAPDMELVEKRRRLNVYRRSVHEILYAPPRGRQS